MNQQIETVCQAAIREASDYKQFGNKEFKDERANEAITYYCKGMEILCTAAESLRDFLIGRSREPIDPQNASRLSAIQKDIDELRISLLLNQALAELKLNRFQEAATHCTQILAFRPGNSKALFRRGVAKVKLGELSEGAEDFQRVLLVDPTNIDARRELKEVRSLLKEEASKNIFARFTDKVADIIPGFEEKKQVIGDILSRIDQSVKGVVEEIRKAPTGSWMNACIGNRTQGRWVEMPPK